MIRSAGLLLVLVACSGSSPDVEPVGPAPGVPAAEPVVPSPEPVVPSQEPVVPSQEPVVPSPEPDVPAPAPEAPVAPAAPAPSVQPVSVGTNPPPAPDAPVPTGSEPAPTAPEPTAPEPGSAARTWTLDPGRGKLYVVVFNDPSSLASGLGHDHAIAGSTYTGTVTWDPADPGACAIDIRLPVDALIVDPPGFREHAGLDPDGAVGEGSKETIVKNLRAKKQLDAAAHPTITFTGARCAARADGRFDVAGTLTVRGTPLQLTVPMTITAADDRFDARGTFEARATQFGFEPFSNLGGALKNRDTMRFVVEVRGRPR